MARHEHTLNLAMAALLSVGMLTACGGQSSEVPADGSAVEAVSVHRTARIDWEKSWDSAFTRAKSEDKPVLVSFQAEWCVWCKKLESTTYRDSTVMALLADSLVPLTLDVDGDGERLSNEHGVESLPTVLVFGADGEERGRINGYLPPSRFVEVMSEILEEI
jgi:thiol:disulfide interchange protein